jgi:hypothetical protein
MKASEDQALLELRRYLKNARARAKRREKAFTSIEKLGSRFFGIKSLLQQYDDHLRGLRAVTKVLRKFEHMSNEELAHLTGKPKNKTAGRNRLGPTIGKW